MAFAKVKEKDIQMAVCDYLAIKGYFFWRTNTTPIFDPTKKIFRAMPKYALRGISDIILVKNGMFIGLEIKRPKGTQSEHQKEFQRKLINAGGQYYLITSMDYLIKKHRF